MSRKVTFTTSQTTYRVKDKEELLVIKIPVSRLNPFNLKIGDTVYFQKDRFYKTSSVFKRPLDNRHYENSISFGTFVAIPIGVGDVSEKDIV